jgi:hypothetical protein
MHEQIHWLEREVEPAFPQADSAVSFAAHKIVAE